MSMKLTPLRFLEKVKKIITENLIAGTNITLTTDSDNKVTITGDEPQTYGDCNLWYPPVSAHASDEEFNATTAFDSGWIVTNTTDDSVGSISDTAVDFYSAFASGDAVRINPDTTNRNSWALIQAPSRNKFYSITKSYTFPTNVLIYARLHFSSRVASTTNNDAGVGIIIGEMDSGKLDNNKYMRLFLNETDANTVQGQWDKHDGAAGYATIAVTQDVDTAGQALEYVAIHKVGSTYYGWIGSPSNWIYMGTTTINNVSPDAVGIVVSNNNTDSKANVVGIDFIRMIETDKFVL